MPWPDSASRHPHCYQGADGYIRVQLGSVSSEWQQQQEQQQQELEMLQRHQQRMQSGAERQQDFNEWMRACVRSDESLRQRCDRFVLELHTMSAEAARVASEDICMEALRLFPSDHIVHLLSTPCSPSPLPSRPARSASATVSKVVAAEAANAACVEADEAEVFQGPGVRGKTKHSRRRKVVEVFDYVHRLVCYYWWGGGGVQDYDKASGSVVAHCCGFPMCCQPFHMLRTTQKHNLDMIRQGYMCCGMDVGEGIWNCMRGFV